MLKCPVTGPTMACLINIEATRLKVHPLRILQAAKIQGNTWGYWNMDKKKPNISHLLSVKRAIDKIEKERS